MTTTKPDIDISLTVANGTFTGTETPAEPDPQGPTVSPTANVTAATTKSDADTAHATSSARPGEGPVLTTSEDAQRDDLPTQPGNA